MVSTANNSCRLLLDVGGTFVKSVVADSAGELIPGSEFTCPMRSDGTAEEILGSLSATVDRGADFAAAHALVPAGIGIAIPGPFDYVRGVARMEHKFRAIYGFSLADWLHALPAVGAAMPLRFVHDVNAVLLGEMTRGNALGYADTAVVTLGTGLGFAFASKNEVQYSPTGSPRLPIYNRSYGDGILEDYVSKRGFLRAYGEIAGEPVDPALTVADLGRMAAEGHAAALETFFRVARILAASLRPVLDRERIECLLLGGQISRSFRFMEPALREGLDGIPSLRRVAPVAHIGEAAFYGVLAGF